MRMFCVQPHLMCKRHITQEHSAMHRFARAIKAGENLSTYIADGHLEQDYIVKRHDELAAELKKRGLRHATPLKLDEQPMHGVVRTKKNREELYKTCAGCKLMQDKVTLIAKKSI